MFENPGKKLKYRNELLLNHCRKSLQSSMRLKDMCRWRTCAGGVKICSHEPVGLSKMLRGRIHKGSRRDDCNQDKVGYLSPILSAFTNIWLLGTNNNLLTVIIISSSTSHWNARQIKLPISHHNDRGLTRLNLTQGPNNHWQVPS